MIDFDKYIRELPDKYSNFGLDADSVEFVEVFESNQGTSKLLDIMESLDASYLTERHGSGWISYLSDSGQLPTTMQTLRNKSEYGLIARFIIENKISDWNTIMKAGATKLRKLHSLGLLNEEWIETAATLSGSDWNKSIKEVQGEEVDDSPKVKCPICHKGKIPVDKSIEILDKIK